MIASSRPFSSLFSSHSSVFTYVVLGICGVFSPVPEVFTAVFVYIDAVAGTADCSGVVVVTEGCCVLSGVEVTAGVEGDGGDCLLSSVVFMDGEDDGNIGI